MTQAFDACIFDFGGVLTSSVRASFAAFEQALALPDRAVLNAFLGAPPDEEPPFFKLEKGLISEGEFYAGMLARLRAETGMDVTWPETPSDVRRKLFGALQRNDVLIDAAVKIGEHYGIAILTNNVREWVDWRELVDAHIFHDVIDSCEVGMRKPEEGIYLLACERIGVDPARAAFIDDIPVNVEGANAVGMRGIRFTTNDDVLAELRVLFPKAFTSEETYA